MQGRISGIGWRGVPQQQKRPLRIGRNKELYNITKALAGERRETRSRRERQARGDQDRSPRTAAEMGGTL